MAYDFREHNHTFPMAALLTTAALSSPQSVQKRHPQKPQKNNRFLDEIRRELARETIGRDTFERMNCIRRANEGNILRINSLPTPSDLFLTHQGANQARLLADEDIEPGTLQFLRRQNFNVVSLNQTRSQGSTKEEVYRQTALLNALLISHNQAFLSESRFDLSRSPGVVVLPKKDGKGSPLTCPRLRAALVHLSFKMPRASSDWVGRIYFYVDNGDLQRQICLAPPGSPDSKKSLTLHTRYMPSYG